MSLWSRVSRIFSPIRRDPRSANGSDGDRSDMQWSPELSGLLDTWGEGNAWSEIPLLLVGARGRVLDLGCGTGVVMQKLETFRELELLGCDITPTFLQGAASRGISKERLAVGDARALKYADDHFNYLYSIGTLHFFSEPDIAKVISESRRVTRYLVYFMIAVSKSGRDEGRVRTYDEFFNNSSDWWSMQFKSYFSEFYLLDSSWEDDKSLGKWCVGVKGRP